MLLESITIFALSITNNVDATHGQHERENGNFNSNFEQLNPIEKTKRVEWFQLLQMVKIGKTIKPVVLIFIERGMVKNMLCEQHSKKMLHPNTN